MLLIKFLIFLTFPAFLLATNLADGNEVNCWATRNRRTLSPRVTGGRTPTRNTTQSGEGMRAETRQNVGEMALDGLDGSMDQSNLDMLVSAALISDNANDDGVTGGQNKMNMEEEAKGADGEDEAEEQQQMNNRPIVLAIQKQKPREANLPTKKRHRSMQQIVGEEGRDDAEQTAEATAIAEEERRNSERKTPKRNTNRSGKDKATSSARARTAAKEQSKGGRGNKLKPLIDLPMDSYVLDLIRGKESFFTQSPHSEGTPKSNNNNNNNTAWHRNIHQIPISEMFNQTSSAAGEEGSSSTKITNNLGEEKRTQSALTASSKEAKDVNSLVGKVERMRVASSSSLSGANMPTDVVVRKTVEEREPKTGAKIRESVIKAASGSVKEMGENVLKFGFFQINFFHEGNLNKLINNREQFAKLVIKRDNDQHGKGAETVSKLIAYLKEKGDPLINEIIAEVLEESAIIFGDNSQKGQKHILLFTYIRLYRKLANALRWALISDSGDNETFVKETNTLLKWLNEMGDTLLNALSKSSITAQWVKNLCRMEAAVELTNFGIFLILSHHTWQSVGAERPTAVNDLFETIGTTEIFEQINDPCDTNCIEQMVKQKLELMNRLRDNSMEKISEIVKNKVSEVEDLLKEMANIKNIPTKNCLFSAIFKQIKKELESADFEEISVPKLAKEKEDGLAFLEKCIKMLDEKNTEYCQCVQKELQMFNELSKANFGGGKTKSDGREGTSNDPISLEE
ncbi:hypothetical protein niasHT_021441 [Heterodera trifolii]|uniref:Uncharacterized protein n=1 Tax=Heterodera trifolii TaxID=157864 RepID=A0ABD2KJY8_9BILA